MTGKKNKAVINAPHLPQGDSDYTVYDNKIFYGIHDENKINLYYFDMQNNMEKKFYSYVSKNAVKNCSVSIKFDNENLYVSNCMVNRQDGTKKQIFNNAVKDGEDVLFSCTNKNIYYLDKDHKVHKINKASLADTIVYKKKASDVQTSKDCLFIKKYDEELEPDYETDYGEIQNWDVPDKCKVVWMSERGGKAVQVSCVELLFPPTATLPQIKFSFSYILSILACCFLRHVFICPLDHSFSFPYSLFVTKKKRKNSPYQSSFFLSYPSAAKTGSMQGHALISDYLSYQQSLCIVMIRKNLLFCKIFRIKTSSKSLFDSYMERFQPEQETCPICGSTGNCHIHHYYGRSIIDFKAGRQEKSDLCILRVFCDSCRHSHAVLPDIIIPYSSYSLFFVLRLLGEYFAGLFTIEQLCERYDISQNQFFKWLALWKSHKKEWLGLLDDNDVSNSAFLKDLATMDSYSSFSMAFIRQQCHSFLQSHRDPVLKSPQNARYHQTVFAPDISIF